MQEVVIIDAIRTPIGKIRGALSSIRPDDLLGQVLATLAARVGIDPKDINEVYAGCANQAGEDNRNVARMACLIAGFPYEVPALTVNRLCASGLSAIVQAARAIQVGDADVVIAGGVESMSRAPLVVDKGDVGQASGNRTLFDTSLGWRFPNPKMAARFPLEAMGETAENLAERYKITRGAQDHFAQMSHERAVKAWAEGRFAAEVVPIETAKKIKVSQDEGPRADSSLEKLSQLKAAFRDGGTVTAGNASTLNDGAAALLLASADMARKLGKKPKARIVANASAGVDPRIMGIGPVPATQKVLKKVGWTLADLDLIELNEAFAAQALAVVESLALPIDRVNVNGGAIALGHPLGCSGARLVTTLVHELEQRGAHRGLASLCVGVGQGESVLVERD